MAVTTDRNGTASPLCEKCGRRPAVMQAPRLCVQCNRARENGRQYSKDHRARERARKTGPPESVALDAEATVSFVAAFLVLDAARERLHAVDRIVQGDEGRDPALSSHLADAALAMADAYDDALSLLKLAMPGGVLPVRNGPWERISETSREALGHGGRIGVRGSRRI